MSSNVVIPDLEEGTEDELDEEKEAQKDAMREWFYERFEDPANSTPYNSREGGYLYILGGPYDASDVLFNEFSGEYSDEVIEELANELNDECWEWAPTPENRDVDSSIYEDILSWTDSFNAFKSGIMDIKSLAQASIENSVQPLFYNLLYVNVITVLETYLGDAFIHATSKEEKRIQMFIQKSGLYRDQKVVKADIFDECDKLVEQAKAEIASTVWHNMKTVRKYYATALGVKVDELSAKKLEEAIDVRHHIVHRNGKDRNGTPVMIDKSQVLALTETIENFVLEIENQLNP